VKEITALDCLAWLRSAPPTHLSFSRSPVPLPSQDATTLCKRRKQQTEHWLPCRHSKALLLQQHCVAVLALHDSFLVRKQPLTAAVASTRCCRWACHGGN